MSNTLFIVNPAGHGGAGKNAWKKFRTLWPDEIDPEHAIVTERPGHALEIATSAAGYDILAAVGGDGTVGEVMSGIMDSAGLKPRLAIIPAGTGNDIARNVGIGSVEDSVRVLREGQPRGFDLIRIDCQNDGRPGHRHAFLHGIVGFSSIPMVKPWMKRLLGPTGAYYLGTLLQVIVYQAPVMTVRTDDRKFSGYTWMVVVGNSETSAGGSMRLSPGARLDDGELNISIFPSLSRLKMVTKLMPKIATGEHVNDASISYFPGRRIAIDSNPSAFLELDGDLFGTTPATFTVCPGALQVMAPQA
ncbi:MAG: diacylglycerol kinase family lipid kinase [Proteobacteria bacterium]|nr:diacylglycerol kinase family lipid kinase [Pseudomonadota bacterium]